MKKGDKRFRFWYACQDAGITEPEAYMGQLYINGMSCDEIAEKLLADHQVTVDKRNIGNYIKKMGIVRNKSEARFLAMKKKRVVYKKKPEHEKYYAKQIGLKRRMEILERDKFTCKLCGNGRHNGYSVEIHHKDGPENNWDNLETRCWMCHRGKHLLDREAK